MVAIFMLQGAGQSLWLLKATFYKDMCLPVNHRRGVETKEDIQIANSQH